LVVGCWWLARGGWFVVKGSFVRRAEEKEEVRSTRSGLPSEFRSWSFVRASFSFVVDIRGEECEGAGSFDVVSELALSAAGPCVPRGHVPPGHEAAHGTQGSPFIFFSFHLGFCVSVCLVWRPRPLSSNRVSFPCAGSSR